MSLFSRNDNDLPGIVGTVRDGSRRERALKRMSAGDIVVIDAPDMSCALAQQLIDAKVAAVVNTSRFTTGAIPDYGRTHAARCRHGAGGRCRGGGL